MLIHKIQIKNYKSFGDDDRNKLYLEPDVTTIIGKNESGKSNLLTGMAGISFFGDMSFMSNSENLNRSTLPGNEIEYEIILKPTESEKGLGLTDDTTINIKGKSQTVIGGLLSYYLHTVKPDIDVMLNEFGENPFKLGSSEYQTYNTYCINLKKDDVLFLKSTTSALAFFTARINNVEENKRLIIKKSLNNVNEKWKSLRDLLPVFFLRTSDRTLNSTYSLDQAKKELDNPEGYPNSLLSSLVKIIGIDKNTFLSTIQPSTAGSVQTIKARVNRKIDSKINNEFNKFYSTENVCLSADFDAGYVIFNARTGDGETLRFDERSNGLRWYMNLFIDIVANELSPSNVIYLFDEPGISLHVNAQNELLKLFVNLAEKGNQIVYTTHLPTMLNLENGGIHKIRSVSKDITGITTICNKAWNPSLSPKSQADTLAPIIQAIGMNINSEFGPSLSKINVICEGPSDYIYLKTFYKYLYPDENGINFIPSQGVSNCIHICNILQGWGCKFVAIFDFDAAGIDDGYTAFDKMGLYTFKKEYMFIKDVSKTEIDSFTPSMTFMIEDLIGRESLQEFISENGLPAGTDKSNKVLLAKLYAPSIIKHSDKASQNCLDKFRELFERIKATQLD